VTLADLATFTHLVTRLKLVPDAAKDPALTEAERSRGAAFAQELSVRALSRAWQILLKGIPEVQTATRPFAAAEMVLVRLAYAADLPTPDEALREQSKTAERERKSGAAEHPLVQAVLSRFPGAEIVDVRDRAEAPAPPPLSEDEAALVAEPSEDTDDEL
jgi:DNA polymerase III subunit gamma/tau